MQQQLKKMSVFFLSVCLLSACGTVKLKYVVYRDIPLHPAFTVVPLSYSAADNRFKAMVESSLIAMGISVVEAPLKKQTTMKIESNAMRAKREMQLHDSERRLHTDDIVETAMIYDQSKADYVILVNAETSVLKITRQSTGEIQAVIEYGLLDKAGSRFIKLQDTLISLGFNIKTISEEEKLKMEYPLKQKGLMRY
ncbi:MAG: hypothetical protein OEY61_03890 [Gammaproteobacteria bacterium]|nr:hypothetical protein [Gammaproteobacteria bacterium]